jgi:CheY-like chemotaxis protein
MAPNLRELAESATSLGSYGLGWQLIESAGSPTGPPSAIPRKDRLVLVVEPDAEERDRLGSWLEAAGYGVINCPGPPRAGMVCLGQRGRACGLVEISDLLVLDLRLVRDAVSERTPGRRLVHYYLSSGKPVVLLGDAAQLAKRYRDDQVVVLPRGRDVSRRTFIKAVQRLEAIA